MICFAITKANIYHRKLTESNYSTRPGDMDMNIQKYVAFVKTVEYGSFTSVAEMLNYSQSGISRMINDLEKEWKVVLLERGKSGVKLTSDGMKLLPCAKNVCMEYEKLQMEVDELNGLKSGLIRIGTFSSVATHWLPNMIRKYQQAYPDIDYEFFWSRTGFSPSCREPFPCGKAIFRLFAVPLMFSWQICQMAC